MKARLSNPPIGFHSRDLWERTDKSRIENYRERAGKGIEAEIWGKSIYWK